MRAFIKTALCAAALFVAAGPADARADTDPGNFSFFCPGCTTAGNASHNYLYELSVAATGTYDIYATGSAGDGFGIFFFTAVNEATGQPDGAAVAETGYFVGSNNLALAGSVFLNAGTQYYVGVLTGDQLVPALPGCTAGDAACNITLNRWELTGSPSVVPEPGSILLLGTGLLGLVGVARRRNRTARNDGAAA